MLHVSEYTVRKHIANLENNKAADPYGVTAEHLKLASPIIAILLTQLINTIFSRADIPEEMKLGVITPLPQKTKCRKIPDNYRRIIVNSEIGKVLA